MAGKYERIIASVFASVYTEGAIEVRFTRADIERAALDLGERVPNNVPDLLYSYRFRNPMPDAVAATAPQGQCWVIKLGRENEYFFTLQRVFLIEPNANLAITKVLDSTPGLVSRYALSDEQALLAKVRYNRLVDTFLGITCYSLQNHLRTSVPEYRQVETDEIYVGVDLRGVQYVIPVQAKGGRDRLNAVQIEQDIAVCRDKFPLLVCRPVAAQFMADEVIALFEFEEGPDGLVIREEKHYRLVPSDGISEQELQQYKDRGGK